MLSLKMKIIKICCLETMCVCLYLLRKTLKRVYVKPLALIMSGG